MIGEYERPGDMWTDVVLQREPDLEILTQELSAHVTGVGLQIPGSYPGTCRILHDSASKTKRKSIKTVAESHVGPSRAKRVLRAREERLNRVTNRELLDALLDNAKLGALRARLL